LIEHLPDALASQLRHQIGSWSRGFLEACSQSLLLADTTDCLRERWAELGPQTKLSAIKAITSTASNTRNVGSRKRQ
jgi:hypothetical protein